MNRINMLISLLLIKVLMAASAGAQSTSSEPPATNVDIHDYIMASSTEYAKIYNADYADARAFMDAAKKFDKSVFHVLLSYLKIEAKNAGLTAVSDENAKQIVAGRLRDIGFIEEKGKWAYKDKGESENVRSRAGPISSQVIEGENTSRASSEYSQEHFENARAGFYRKYKSQKNEILKSQVFREANEWTRNFGEQIGWTIRDWEGKITRISTSHGGEEASLTIESSRDGFTCQYKAVSIFGLDESSIKMGTKVYNQLAEFQEGDYVYFSCNLYEDKEKGIRENSLTEEGSLRVPELVIKFTNIRKQ